TFEVTPGDRRELGPLTLPQSDYILLGTPLAKSSMIAQAESSGTMPIHVRDENTGAWLDNQAHPYGGFINSGAPGFPIPNTSFPRLNDDWDHNCFGMETSHSPSLTYAPYLFTDDPYYLEELQAMALFNIIDENYHPPIQKLPGLVNPGETRGTA